MPIATGEAIADIFAVPAADNKAACRDRIRIGIRPAARSSWWSGNRNQMDIDLSRLILDDIKDARSAHRLIEVQRQQSLGSD
jgi:hypothetical protein